MVIEERISETLIRHYSDQNKYLLQVETGIDTYEDAIDLMPCQYTYEETDEDIPDPEETENEMTGETPEL